MKTRLIMNFAQYSALLSKPEIGTYTYSKKRASEPNFKTILKPWLTPPTSTKTTYTVNNKYGIERPVLCGIATNPISDSSSDSTGDEFEH